MDNKQIAEQLKSICQLDMDAIYAYGKAPEHIGEMEIKSTIGKNGT